MKLKGIRGRWMVNSIIVVVLIAVIAILAFSAAMNNYYYTSLRTGLESKAQTATELFSSYVTKTYSTYYTEAYKYTEMFEEKNSLELQFINPRGKIETSSYGKIAAGYSPGTPDITQCLETGAVSSWQGNNPTTGERIMSVSAPIQYPNGSIVGIMRYVTSLKLVDQRVLQITAAASLVGLVVVIMVFLSNTYFTKTITEPISSLTTMAKQIAEGSYGIQAEKQFDDEIGELTDAINEMSSKISLSEKMQTEFISSVSHELRTPLTAITGWSETLMYNTELEPESRRGLTIISREAARLTKLVEELLEFTRIQDGRFNLSIELVDIQAEIEDCLFAYSDMLEQEELKLEYSPPEKDLPLIPGDPERIRQVILNILDNAAKYGKNGERINVSLDKKSDYVVLSVHDHGPGIPESELPYVKKMFYKGSSKERGSGIGLAVCDEIVSRHGGDLIIGNAEDGGLLVTVRLPISRN